MASLIRYLSTTVLLIQSTVAFNCSKPPIYVDIHRRYVNNSTAPQYGSFIGVGTPAQNQSLWPSTSHNHISFTSSKYCESNGTTLAKCYTSTGGFFNTDSSHTFLNRSDVQSLDKNGNKTFIGTFGQDNLHLYTHYFETDGASQTLVENSTVEIAQSGSIAPSIVGIGFDSTVLRDLVAADLIAGKTYSLYIGQGFDRAAGNATGAGGAVNGSNTFGGYDAGRFTGKVHQYSMNPANLNPMSVKVKDIYITHTDNSQVSLFDNTKFPSMKSRPDTFEAQITTDQFPFSLPYQITQNFKSHLDAQEDNYWGDNSFKLKSPFSGSLTVELDDGFKVTLPSEVVSNMTNITPIQDRKENSTSPFYLGTAFLGQVYLMADFESQNFFLAKAVQKNNPVMPQTFCPRTVPQAYEPPQRSAWRQQGLIGAVIGGVIGGMGIAGFMWCFILGCKRRRAEKKLEREMEEGKQAKEAKIAQFAQMEVEDFDPPPETAKTSRSFFWKKR